MANAKRASMREGPLAALFRKTEELEAEAEALELESERPQAPPAERRAQRYIPLDPLRAWLGELGPGVGTR